MIGKIFSKIGAILLNNGIMKPKRSAIKTTTPIFSKDFKEGYAEYAVNRFIGAVPSEVEVTKIDCRKLRIRSYAKTKRFKVVRDEGYYNIYLGNILFQTFKTKKEAYEWLRRW